MPTEREADQIKANETKLQPDPFVKEGRASTAWVWTIGIAVIVVIAVYFFAVGYNKNPTPVAGNNPPQHATKFTTGASNKPPETAVPAGRTPKEGDYHTVR